MLPKGKRLTRASFAPLAAGTRAISAHFSVTYLSSPEGRAAAVVSKKVTKKATDRHLLKRRILAAAAPHVVPGRSFVVYARSGSPTLSYPILKKEIDTLLTSLPRV